jgi:N6-adenosine-specific RNA methylase IME4
MKCQGLADVPEDKFEKLLGEWRKRALSDENASISLRSREKAERRAAREAELGKRQKALPSKRYGVIVADPEWQFEVWSENGKDRAAENHYPTSPTEVIASRDVPSIAADDCVLALWSTVPMLPAALRVMEAWGFSYKTNFCWVKDRIGPGYWNRNKHELLLIGTKGDVPCPAPGDQWDSALVAPRRGHSEKPEIFLSMIESYYPTLPKIELNRRGPPRKNWDAWGFEADEDYQTDDHRRHKGRKVAAGKDESQIETASQEAN